MVSAPCRIMPCRLRLETAGPLPLTYASCNTARMLRSTTCPRKCVVNCQARTHQRQKVRRNERSRFHDISATRPRPGAPAPQISHCRYRGAGGLHRGRLIPSGSVFPILSVFVHVLYRADHRLHGRGDAPVPDGRRLGHRVAPRYRGRLAYSVASDVSFHSGADRHSQALHLVARRRGRGNRRRPDAIRGRAGCSYSADPVCVSTQ